MSKRVFTLISLIGLSFTINCSDTTGPSVSNKSTQTAGVNREDAFDIEKFRAVDVAAKEILFKFEPCETDDRKAFLDQVVTPFARQTTKDDQMTVSQVGNGCWFLGHSSNLTVDKLFDPLQSKIQVNFVPGPTSQQTPQVVAVEPNFIIRLTTHPGDMPVVGSPGDDYFQKGKLWGLSNLEHPGIDVDALRAWELSKGSEQIVVGVIDTGIDYDHPDLRANVWTAPRDFKIRLGTDEIFCLKGSHGYNIWGKTDQERCDPMDGIGTTGHGTHVAGIIGAVGNNDVGVVGVNWTVKLLGLKYMRGGGGTVANAAKAIDFAIELKKMFGAKANIRVLNASWGYLKSTLLPSDSQLLREKIENAGQVQMLLAASAGEDNSNNDEVEHYPSGYSLPNVISVTAVDSSGALVNLSNFGVKSVDLSAPGSDIYSTYSRNLGYDYYVSGGTSMAAPFVSGAAALILSVPRCSKLSASELKDAIIRGVINPTRAPIPPIPTATGGMLNVYQSIERCVK